MNRHANRTPLIVRLRRIVGSVAAAWHKLRSFLSLNSIRDHWYKLSDSRRLFLSNIGFAILIAGIVSAFHQSHWLVRLENSAMDSMMEVNKGLTRMRDAGTEGELLFTFLDIDDASYRKWGEPYHAPRDKINGLVEFAARSGARMIVLDIDLSREGIKPDDDRKLAEFLSQYGKENEPPLILVRTFYGENSGAGQWVDIRPSFLDAYKFSAAIHWAQPLFKATLWDGVIRHWHLVKFGCLNGRLVLVPATQLIATALLSGREASSVNRFADASAIRLVNCGGGIDDSVATSLRETGEPGGDFGPQEDLGQRLIYSIPWKGFAPDLTTISASLITDTGRSLSDDLVRDRVVIIGASFADSRDIHRTPIGEMPGALIIANAIKSLTTYGQVRSPAPWAKWVQTLAVILLAAWAFSRFTSLIAVSVAGAIIIVALVPISFYFFKYGLWIDFAIPLFAMVIHRAVAEYRSSRRRLRDTGELPNKGVT